MTGSRNSPPRLETLTRTESAADVSHRQQLVEGCQGLVRSLAWQIHQKLPRGVDLEDLIAYGQIGLAQAARDFNAGHGTQFTTYAWYRTRGAILDGLAQMSWFSRHAFHGGVYERMSHEVMELDKESGPDDADAGIAGDIGWFTQMTGTLCIAHLAAGAEPSQPGVDASRSVLAEAIQSESCGNLLRLIDALPDDARLLIRAAYFEGTTLQEAGRRIGISKAWASRLHAKTLRRLGAALRLAGSGE